MSFSDKPTSMYGVVIGHDGRLLDCIDFPEEPFDSQTMEQCAALIRAGEGEMPAPFEGWHLKLSGPGQSARIGELSVHNHLICTMMFLSGRDIRSERQLIYRVIRTLPVALCQSKPDSEMSYELLSVSARPLAASIFVKRTSDPVRLTAQYLCSQLGTAWLRG